ncbi:MAG: hypothetical protein JSS72_09360 [Armatimonadetes bacterium]|nr:hypothetical protein [Armatimonadota bacterium]
MKTIQLKSATKLEHLYLAQFILFLLLLVRVATKAQETTLAPELVGVLLGLATFGALTWPKMTKLWEVTFLSASAFIFVGAWLLFGKDKAALMATSALLIMLFLRVQTLHQKRPYPLSAGAQTGGDEHP